METITTLILFAAVTAGWCLASIRVGWWWCMKKHPALDQADAVNAYIKDKFPSEWAAYNVGVREGYAQGMSDREKMP